MGEIRKIGDEYYIEFYARGLKYQQKGGASRAEAERLLKEIEEKIARGEESLIVRDVDLNIFFFDFLEHAKAEHTPRTVLRYQAVVRTFEEFLKAAPARVRKLSGITPGVIERYKSRLKGKPRGVNFSLLLLSDILQYGIKLGYINDDPTLHVRLLDMGKGRRPPVLDHGEMARIAKKGSPEAKMTEWMALTGMSVGEVSALQFSDIDEKNNRIRTGSEGDHRRHGLRRSVPMHPRVREIFEELKNEDRASGPVFGDERPEISAVLTRNTFAHDLIARGMRLSTLYKLLGFGDIAMAAKYLVFRWDYLKKAVMV
jgi:integrase